MRENASKPASATNSMGIWIRLRQRCEVFLVLLGLRIIPPLPRHWVLRLARWAGVSGFVLARELRKVGLANLQLAFGDALDEKARRVVLRKSFVHFARVVLDALWFSRDTATRTNRYVHFDESMDVLFQDEPQVCVTAHMGNWELIAMAFAARGHALSSVAALLANPSVGRLFIELRERTGQEIIVREGAVRVLLKRLRQGRKIALVLDQNTRLSEGGVFVNFFGVPATVSPIGASLALHTGSKVVTGFCFPQPDGSYVVSGTPGGLAVEQNRVNDREALIPLTQEITSITEDFIRKMPSAWLWMYRRWKYIAPGDDAKRYPYYAKHPVVKRTPRTNGLSS